MNLKVHGKVHMVNYRRTVRKWAEELNIVGFVVNESDGSVRVEAQGDKKKLEELLSRCYAGPKQAEVSEIEQTWRQTDQQFTSFEIR